MAHFSVTGLDELYEDISRAAKVPDRVKAGVVTAMGQIIRNAQAKLASQILRGPFRTGATAKSVSLNKPRLDGSRTSVSVTFKGIRKRGKEKISVTRNAAIAFINEFGKNGQPARPFIRRANEENAEKAVEAGKTVFDRWLQENNL